MSTDTKEILDRLRVVCDDASPLPWEQCNDFVIYNSTNGDDGGKWEAEMACQDDAEFVALSRTALPALICIAEAAAKVHDYDWGDMEMNDETGEYTEVIEGILGALGSLASLKE